MWSSSKQGAAVKTEVLEMNEENVDELSCLSGDKPFFDVILGKSHVESPYYMCVPVHMAPLFPSDDVTTVVRYGAKQWRMVYHGRTKRHHFEYSDWKRFVAHNHLRIGDACIFEVMESSSVIVRLRAVILRNTKALPAQLNGAGDTPQAPILLD